MDAAIIISPYNDEWAIEFQKESKKIMGAIGDKVISIEHIGSTSVPGLGAKSLIDMMVAINNIDDADTLIEPLARLGYEFVPKTEFPKRRFFRRGEWRAGTHHLHVYEQNSIEWQENILFREYLRRDPETVKQYQRLKEELAAKFRNNRVAYTQGKADFIRSIIDTAWREQK